MPPQALELPSQGWPLAPSSSVSRESQDVTRRVCGVTDRNCRRRHFRPLRLQSRGFRLLLVLRCSNSTASGLGSITVLSLSPLPQQKSFRSSLRPHHCVRQSTNTTPRWAYRAGPLPEPLRGSIPDREQVPHCISYQLPQELSRRRVSRRAFAVAIREPAFGTPRILGPLSRDALCLLGAEVLRGGCVVEGRQATCVQWP